MFATIWLHTLSMYIHLIRTGNYIMMFGCLQLPALPQTLHGRLALLIIITGEAQ